MAKLSETKQIRSIKSNINRSKSYLEEKPTLNTFYNENLETDTFRNSSIEKNGSPMTVSFSPNVQLISAQKSLIEKRLKSVLPSSISNVIPNKEPLVSILLRAIIKMNNFIFFSLDEITFFIKEIRIIT